MVARWLALSLSKTHLERSLSNQSGSNCLMQVIRFEWFSASIRNHFETYFKQKQHTPTHSLKEVTRWDGVNVVLV